MHLVKKFRCAHVALRLYGKLGALNEHMHLDWEPFELT